MRSFPAGVARDARHAWHALIQRPGFTASAVATMALGIGMTTAVFTVLNRVVLRPLAFPEAERLVVLFEGLPQSGLPRMMVSAADFTDYRSHHRSFEGLAAYRNHEFEFSTPQSEPTRVTGAHVSANLLPLLRVHPALGRGFSEDENQVGANRVAVLSYEFWQRQFGGDRAVAGRAVMLDRETHPVVGVLPPGVEVPPRLPGWESRPADVYVPIAFMPAELRVRGGGYNKLVIGRLRADVTVEQATADVAAIARRIHDESFPPDLRDAAGFELTASVVPLHEAITGPVRPALLLLFGASVLVLLVACADVTGLLLVRAVARRREIAVRTALGAAWRDVVRLFLSESLVLATLATGAGVGLSVVATRALRALTPAELPRSGDIGLDAGIVLFGSIVGFLAAVPFTSGAILAARGSALGEELKERSASSTLLARGGRNRLHPTLVVATMAMAVMLLAGTGLLLRSFVNVLNTDPGFRPQQVLTMQVPLARQQYRRAEDIRPFYDALLADVAALPGVVVAGAGNDVPLEGQETRTFWPEEDEAVASATAPVATHSWVLGDYFAAHGIALRSGRYFSERDTRESPPVAIVNEALARRIWPGERAVGKRLKFGTADTRSPWLTVVGVVADVKDAGLEAQSTPHTYIPYHQTPDGWLELAGFAQLRALYLAIRTSGDPASFIAAVRDRVRRLDPQLALAAIRTMEEHLSHAVAPRRFLLTLVAVFGVAALLLAAVGLYGMLAFAVTQRTHELGIRSALGATAGHVLALVAGRGLRLAMLGIAIGLAAAVVAGRFVSAQLFGVTAFDPPTLAAVAVVTMLAAALASYLPARRAARVDPIIALKQE